MVKHFHYDFETQKITLYLYCLSKYGYIGKGKALKNRKTASTTTNNLLNLNMKRAKRDKMYSLQKSAVQSILCRDL